MLKKKTPRRSDLIPRHKFRQDADRAAKHGDEDRSENKICHDYLPNTCHRAQILWPYSRTDH